MALSLSRGVGIFIFVLYLFLYFNQTMSLCSWTYGLPKMGLSTFSKVSLKGNSPVYLVFLCTPLRTWFYGGALYQATVYCTPIISAELYIWMSSDPPEWSSDRHQIMIVTFFLQFGFSLNLNYGLFHYTSI